MLSQCYGFVGLHVTLNKSIKSTLREAKNSYLCYALDHSVREVMIKHVAGSDDDKVTEELLTARKAGVWARGPHTLR